MGLSYGKLAYDSGAFLCEVPMGTQENTKTQIIRAHSTAFFKAKFTQMHDTLALLAPTQVSSLIHRAALEAQH